MALNHLFALVEDLNGPSMYSSKRAMFGYISPHERLQIPSWLSPQLRTAAQDQALLHLSTVDVLEIAEMNYAALVGGGTSENDSLWVSLLRARWIQLGCLLRTRQDRAVPIDEVDEDTRAQSYDEQWEAANPIAATARDQYEVQKLNSADLGDAAFQTYIKKISAALLNHVNQCATNLWALSAHIFRVRGHHYKAEFEDTIERTWKATTLDLPNTAPSWQVLVRVATHPFGVKALRDGFEFFLSQEALAPSFDVRKDAFPAGAAMIGTGYAVLQQMKSAAWWVEFSTLYQGLVDSVEHQHGEILKAPFRYHQAAGLYGEVKRDVDDTSVRALAPLLKGFITVEAAGTAISRQKTLDKHAEQNPATQERFAIYLEMLLNRVKQAKSLSEALGSSAVPGPSAPI